MELRPEEITGILKNRIKEFDSKISLTDTGTVVTVGDGIVNIHGLENCMINELLQFENGVPTTTSRREPPLSAPEK